ncbi:MAG: hypothetical protein JOY75_19875 [Hyphomicrobiales bacterium]|nr:hypothetical protein [Hyphomicrobiales bacterium]
MISRLSLVLAFVAIAAAAVAAELAAVPDERITPGAILDTNPAVVCAPGYARAHRVWHDKASTLMKYGLPLPQAPDFEDDDRIPICAGGDNADPRNHWPQRCTAWEGIRCVAGPAFEKDPLEGWVCRAVCDEHRLPLDAAQRMFLGDWRVAYRQAFGKPP